MPVSLDGLTIMVVEDDFLAALDLKRLVEERAGKVAGPVGRLEQAQQLARSVSARRRHPRREAQRCRLAAAGGRADRSSRPDHPGDGL